MTAPSESLETLPTHEAHLDTYQSLISRYSKAITSLFVLAGLTTVGGLGLHYRQTVVAVEAIVRDMHAEAVRKNLVSGGLTARVKGHLYRIAWEKPSGQGCVEVTAFRVNPENRWLNLSLAPSSVEVLNCRPS